MYLFVITPIYPFSVSFCLKSINEMLMLEVFILSKNKSRLLQKRIENAK